jgi:hypothetical protein
MVGRRSCGKSILGVRSAALEWSGGQLISFNCTSRGNPLRTVSIRKQAFLCLAIDDGEKAASPK